MSNGRLFPNIPEEVPQRNNRFSLALGQGYFRVTGWRVSGNFPQLSKFLIIVAPHTSNWDFMIAAGAIFGLDLRIRFMVKHTLFWEPFGTYLRWVGGIPIDRRAEFGVVGEAVKAYQSNDKFVLGITPEGTRKKVKQWKTGFYRIAVGANVPIVPVAFDYGRKVVDLMPPFYPTGDIENDMVVIKGFFEDVQGKHGKAF
ncbi:MAG: lysophospholipid acyltransferase family protein [Anaerolineales bacterium]|nr:lysophospholipid acyltransferase family protein [Anaerolineales bacterium]